MTPTKKGKDWGGRGLNLTMFTIVWYQETREVFEKIETLCKQRAQTLTTEFNLAKEGGGDIKGVRNNENVVWPMNWRFNRLYRV